ncbi:hypothetical protein RJ640_018755 [Escallonia rubra]|uniref:RNA polymerase Rpb1 domain-containing protein n=1 Tax=Escallonia rubra TaxID=112253 RepID=A0AA88RI19_9ASTE|nr:hypothetical protein RJ640_018755 [Escallonia rubra]
MLPEHVEDLKTIREFRNVFDAEVQKLEADGFQLGTKIATTGDNSWPMPVNLKRLIWNAHKTFKVDLRRSSDMHLMEIVEAVDELQERLKVVTGDDAMSMEAQKNATLFFSILLRSTFATSLLIHFFCDGISWGPPGDGSSAGSAEAVLVTALRTRNAKIGERSKVPPSGGMSPRNMFNEDVQELEATVSSGGNGVSEVVNNEVVCGGLKSNGLWLKGGVESGSAIRQVETNWFEVHFGLSSGEEDESIFRYVDFERKFC